MNRIPIVIPAYEPDEQLVALCNNLIHNGLTDIIVIDDGSGQEYQKYFDELKKNGKCKVLKHAVNLGKGRALKDAFNYLLNEDNTIIGCVTADSDGQHSPTDIKKCIDALIEHPDNLILGCRDFDNEDVPLKSKAGNKITIKVCKWLAGVTVSDTQTGLRAIPRRFMAELLSVNGERFEFETNMLISSKDNYPIIEVPIETIYDSKKNHKTHFNPIKDSIRIYKIFGTMFMKFLFSSLSSCVLDLILFNMFCAVFKPVSIVMYITIATVVARVISATYNYVINYSLVFHSKERKSSSIVKYFTLAIIQMSLSALLVTIGVHLIPFVAEVLVKIVVDICLFFISYRIQREFVFK